MTQKDINAENQKIANYKDRISILYRKLDTAKGKCREEIMRDISVLKHKILATEGRLHKTSINNIAYVFQVDVNGFYSI